MGWSEIIATAIVSLIGGGGLGAWLLKLFDRWREAKRAGGEDVWQKQASLIARLDEQLVRVQADLGRAMAGEAVCRQQVVRLQSVGEWLYGLLQNHHAALTKLRPDMDPLPEFPDFRAEEKIDAAARQFAQRASEHTSALLRQEVREAQQP